MAPEFDPAPLRILLLCTDAFGGRGGIAEFNRNLSRALAAWPGGCRLTVLPCHLPDPVADDDLPAGVSLVRNAARGRLHFTSAALRTAFRHGPFDLVVCGHLYLVRTGALVQLVTRSPLVGVLHGIEAWRPPPRRTIRWLVPRLDRAVAVSALTRSRFLTWSRHPESAIDGLPNAIDLTRYSPGPKRDDLLQRYGLAGRTVLLTLARLDAAERYKGIDEVMAVFPSLRAECPDLLYLVAGDGSDRPRLEAQAHQLGLAEAVRFLGYVPEAEKQDVYRLADAFVMPGRGEGFGIVYLEAMACGIPVVASTLDASREAVRDGLLGELADPDDPASVRAAIVRALARPRGVRPAGLEYFSSAAFTERVHALLPVFLAARRQG